MKNILLFIIAILPVLFICTYIYYKDKDKEPTKLLFNLFFKGILSCLLVFIISHYLKLLFPFLLKEINVMNRIEKFFYAFIGIGLVEEVSKWLFVYFAGYKNKFYDERYDIIVYSVFVSLGFALFENLLYVFGYNSIQLGITRAILAVPGHACDAVFMGYYLTLAKQYGLNNNPNKELEYKIKSIMVPALLHGIYDFCLFQTEEIFILVFFIFILYLFSSSVMKIYKISKYNFKLELSTPRYCKKCGNVVKGDFCSVCGTPVNENNEEQK